MRTNNTTGGRASELLSFVHIQNGKLGGVNRKNLELYIWNGFIASRGIAMVSPY